MIIDISFGWRHDDESDDSDTGQNTLAQDHGDCDIIRPVAILNPAADTSSEATIEKAIDPYDNDYWTKLPLH